MILDHRHVLDVQVFLMICNLQEFQSQLVGVERDKDIFPVITMSLRVSMMSSSQKLRVNLF